MEHKEKSKDTDKPKAIAKPDEKLEKKSMPDGKNQ